MNLLFHFVASEVIRELCDIPDPEGRGIHLVWKCPGCTQVKGFRLMSYGGEATSEGVKNALLLELQCTGCGYEIKAPAAEYLQLEQARLATQELQAGRLSPADYLEQLLALDAKFVKDLVALTTEWQCPECGEKHPMSFDSCWNCSSQGAGPTEETDPEAKPMPGFPTGGNPWEAR